MASNPIALWNGMVNKAIELYGMYDNAFPNIGRLEAEVFAKYFVNIPAKSFETLRAQSYLRDNLNRVERNGNQTFTRGHLLDTDESGILIDPLKFWEATGKVAKLLAQEG